MCMWDLGWKRQHQHPANSFSGGPSGEWPLVMIFLLSDMTQRQAAQLRNLRTHNPFSLLHTSNITNSGNTRPCKEHHITVEYWNIWGMYEMLIKCYMLDLASWELIIIVWMSSKKQPCPHLVILNFLTSRRNISTFCEMNSQLTFLQRVWWKDWHHSHIYKVNIKTTVSS